MSTTELQTFDVGMDLMRCGVSAYDCFNIANSIIDLIQPCVTRDSVIYDSLESILLHYSQHVKQSVFEYISYEIRVLISTKTGVYHA